MSAHWEPPAHGTETDWDTQEFHPDDAARGAAAGFRAVTAAAWRDVGFDSPEEAAQWAARGTGPADAMRLAARGDIPDVPAAA